MYSVYGSRGKKWFVKLEGNGDPTKIPVVSANSTSDGIYTFIVDQRGRVKTSRINNGLELNAKHFSIVLSDPSITSVRGAGELRKIGTNIEFNVLSGTFMLDWIDGCESEIIEETKRSLQDAFPTNTITYTPAEYARTQVDEAALDSYVAAGYEVRLYPTKRACLTYSPSFYEVLLEKKIGDLTNIQTQLELSKSYIVYVPPVPSRKRKRSDANTLHGGRRKTRHSRHSRHSRHCSRKRRHLW